MVTSNLSGNWISGSRANRANWRRTRDSWLTERDRQTDRWVHSQTCDTQNEKSLSDDHKLTWERSLTQQLTDRQTNKKTDRQRHRKKDRQTEVCLWWAHCHIFLSYKHVSCPQDSGGSISRNGDNEPERNEALRSDFHHRVKLPITARQPFLSAVHHEDLYQELCNIVWRCSHSSHSHCCSADTLC